MIKKHFYEPQSDTHLTGIKTATVVEGKGLLMGYQFFLTEEDLQKLLDAHVLDEIIEVSARESRD